MVNKLNKLKNHANDNDQFNQLTYGIVVDTNDPQQMGRVRAVCGFFGENGDTAIGTIPWATPISPLAGSSRFITRGRSAEKTVGPVSYGMFNVPKVGSHVIIGCIEGDPKQRIYLGGINDQLLTHTMPHGRYSYNENNEKFNGDKPYGPFSSTEDPILPLFNTQTEAFIQQTSPTSQSTPSPRKSFEYRTRGADFGVSGVHNDYIIKKRSVFTDTEDPIKQKFTETDGNEINYTFGYNESEIHKGFSSYFGDGNIYDSQTYSWTTPGFHAISMSDTQENCRIRIRSTQGHQIIMDDTNERIYISTAGGKTWIEMDEAGNIDIYGERNISVHAEKDINFTAGDTFRVKAKNGIHLASESEIRLHSGSDMNINSGGELYLKSTSDTNILSAGDILQTGSAIHLNGPPAAPAVDAFWTSRVPEHEPWARVMTKKGSTDVDAGNTHSGSGEFSYDDKNVGRTERGSDLKRNPKWHR